MNYHYDEEENRASYEVHYMMIRPMFFVNDWPVFGPEPYQGEQFEPISLERITTTGECLTFIDRDNSMVISKEISSEDIMKYGKNCIVYKCTDFENDGEIVAVTGIDDSGLVYWGKFSIL